MYNSKTKCLHINGKQYYFYNGLNYIDSVTEFIISLIMNGYEPPYRENLCEMYTTIINIGNR